MQGDEFGRDYLGGPAIHVAPKVPTQGTSELQQDLRISPSSAFKRASSTSSSSSSSKYKDLKNKKDGFPFLVVKRKQEGTPTDLHPFFRKCDWKSLLESIKVLQRSADSTDLEEVFTSLNGDGETILHTCAWKAPPRLALMLLELVPMDRRKEFLLMLDSHGNTPLHLACANLDERVEFAVIKNILLLAPEALEIPNFYGDSPLHLLVTSPAFAKSPDFSVEAAAEEAITSLLMMVGYLATQKNQSGATLLHCAIAHGAHERVLVKLLNLAGEAASIADSRGMLPVHYVAAFGGTPWTFVGQLIWANPSSITHQTQNGDTPLHLLASNSLKHIKNKEKFVDRNTTKLAELLVGSGAEDVSPLMVQNNEKMSPLHCCALFDTPPQLTRVIMESPLAQSASALTTEFGATALHLACASSSVSDSLANVELLATRQACSVKDSNNRTPLMVAVQNPKASGEVIKALCNTYSEAAAMSLSRGHLPLHLAVQGKRIKSSVVRALVKAYPESVNLVTRSGNTALHEACAANAQASVLEFLIDRNRDALLLQNKHGETPLDLAIASGATQETISLLDGSSLPKRSVRSTYSSFTADFDVLSGMEISLGSDHSKRDRV